MRIASSNNGESVSRLTDNPGVVWFRRDLRLDDNPAWAAATANHREVVALVVLDPRVLARSGELRTELFLANVRALDDRLRDLGAGLTVRSGAPWDAVPEVIDECSASTLYLNVDASRYAQQRDADVAAKLRIPVRRLNGNTVHEPGSVLTKAGTLSQVFTPFFRTWQSVPLTPWPEPGAGVPVQLRCDDVPDGQSPRAGSAGEEAAWQRLNDWLALVEDYPDTRDLPGIVGTSELSADLKFGAVAARAILDAVGTHSVGRAAFVRQLAWRDWWAHTLTRRPELVDAAWKPSYDAIEWNDDPAGFDAWKRGQTGYPIVDAGMRQLRETGWMHNRVRMITASFLVKDLLIDWRFGERYFRHQLIDADIAQNAGNWQWVAGTGPDAAPYFRIFNPTSQSKKFDPDGAYIKTWVPELAGLTRGQIHRPSDTPPFELLHANVVLGDTYPYPIVDHAEARLQTLDAYKAVRE